jgi:hypothetical protein
MDTSFQILVIILSTALAVLLVLAIVIAVMTIKLMQQIRRISDKAEHVIQNAEQAAQAFKSATGSMAIFKLVKNITSMVSKSKGKK